jgi:hypothetical protein
MEYPKFITVEQYHSLHKDLSETDLLTKFSENLKTIQSLSTKHYEDFSVLIDEYLNAGNKIFQMEFGIVSSIVGDEYFICDALSPENSLKKGDKFELEGTYCREVVKSGGVIGFPHVGGLPDMKDHPVYVNMKLESYISAPIRKEGQVFGTLNFSSTRPREHGFSENEKELILLMANAIGTFLLLQDKEQNLKNAIKRIKTLTGYVAHDLRSPLANVKSILELLPELDEGEKKTFIKEAILATEKGLEIVYTILNAAIIGDGKISLNKQAINLKSSFEESLSEVLKRWKADRSRVELNSETIEANCERERIQQFFIKLVSYAFTYSIDDSKIHVVIKKEGSMALFSITNKIDKSKLKYQRGNVTEDGSIGFGIEIIKEVLKLHDSTLEITQNESQYSASFKLDLN